MKVLNRRVLLCDCEHTMTLDVRKLAKALATDEPFLHTHLCRTQIDSFRRAAESGEALLVCCTQEAPLFAEIAGGVASAAEPGFVNIRERAGWSDEGRQAHPKIAALIAEAALAIEPTPALTIRSTGDCLIYGAGEAALAAAGQLASRLRVSCVLTDVGDAMPPAVRAFPILRGRVRKAGGHFGGFVLTVDDCATARASCRDSLDFDPGRERAELTCEIILDLSGEPPLFPAAARRDGYVRAEPSDPVGVQRALFEVADLAGEFEKPRYLRIDPAICAYSRNQVVGCGLCLDVCPSGAITPNGDHVAVDPIACAGHGACASVCPTGAIVFDIPRGNALFERLRTLAKTYREAGGEALVLLVHDSRHGDQMIAAMARGGNGLPAHVVPFLVSEVTMVGLDFLLHAVAYGAAQVRILAGPEHRDALEPLRRHAGLVEAVMGGLGYAGGRVVLDDEADPQRLAESLRTPPPAAIAEPAAYRAAGEKRTGLTAALDHLFRRAPAPVEVLALPAGAPFGLVQLHRDRCTLCLSCVGVCPTGALAANPDRPQLAFSEIDCVQCGLCRNTCPEDAIALEPRLNFAEAARRKVVLKEEEPFQCIRCGKPFGTRSTIDRLVDKLAGHTMFASADRLLLIKMCEDCRVIAQFDEAQPFAAGVRPLPRTTDDDLREREEARRRGRKSTDGEA